MEGTIINFKRGRRTQTPNQVIVSIPDVTSKEDAEKLVGKKAVWTSPAGKELLGEVRSPHGSKGSIRILFNTGMPGQSIGTKLKVA